MRLRAITLACCVAAISSNALAQGCKTWGEPERIGTLDGKTISEASGIAVSRQYPGRLYHNNDSGDGPNFYVSDFAGGNLQTVSISGFDPVVDVEEMALGKCGRKTCLYLGDIGDNPSQRKDVRFVLISEKATYTTPETPLRIVTAHYPDAPHDAEAFSIHPNGDLYLITKPIDWNQRKAGVAQIFKLTAKQLSAGDGSPQTFQEVADLDLPWLLWISGVPGQIVTAMDISPDGKRFVFLTYQTAVEVELDLSKPLKPLHSWRPDHDFHLIQTSRLIQQEALAYLPEGSIVYDSETAGAPEAPLYKQSCTAR